MIDYGSSLNNDNSFERSLTLRLIQDQIIHLGLNKMFLSNHFDRKIMTWRSCNRHWFFWRPQFLSSDTTLKRVKSVQNQIILNNSDLKFSLSLFPKPNYSLITCLLFVLLNWLLSNFWMFHQQWKIALKISFLLSILTKNHYFCILNYIWFFNNII